MPNEEHFHKLEHMYLSAPCNKPLDLTISISEGRAEINLQVRPELYHAANAVHGSFYFKLMDDSSFFAANSLVEGVFVLTMSYNVYFVRPISEGEMRAVGRVVHHSRRLLLAESEVFDSEDRLIGRGSGTFMRGQIPLTPDIGYT